MLLTYLKCVPSQQLTIIRWWVRPVVHQNPLDMARVPGWFRQTSKTELCKEQKGEYVQSHLLFMANSIIPYILTKNSSETVTGTFVAICAGTAGDMAEVAAWTYSTNFTHPVVKYTTMYTPFSHH